MEKDYKNRKSFKDKSQYFGRNEPWTKRKELDKTGPIEKPHRAHGSTHRSETKDRIVRSGRKTARQEAKKIIRLAE